MATPLTTPTRTHLIKKDLRTRRMTRKEATLRMTKKIRKRIAKKMTRIPKKTTNNIML